MFRPISIFYRIIFVAVLGFAACSTGRAQITTVAYDGFDYTGGAALSGQNGGTGWTSAWVNDYPDGQTLDVSSTGMTYTGLTTSPGSVVWGSGAYEISEDSRDLPLQDTGVVYVQFLAQFTESSSLGTPNIRLIDDGTVTGAFGANGGTTMSILNASLTPNGTSSSSAPISDVNFVIARIDYTNDDTEMWVDPDLYTFNYADPSTTPDATYSGLAPAFNEIAIYTRDNANVDEITIMSMPIPEPGPGALFTLGAGMMLWGWRLRSRFR